MGRLDGKIAAVTGGASGIGEATVRRFAAEGASVAFCDRDGDRGRRVAAELEATGAKVSFTQADVGTEAGKHIISDKPLAISAKEGARLRDAANAASILAQNEMFHFKGTGWFAVCAAGPGACGFPACHPAKRERFVRAASARHH